MKVESSVVTDLPCRVREWVQGNEKVSVFWGVSLRRFAFAFDFRFEPTPRPGFRVLR